MNNPFEKDFADKTVRKISPKNFFRTLIFAVVIIAILSLLSTCWYTVDEKEQAVIMTFGKVTGTADAGIHFKLPFGIQTVEKVQVNVYQKIELGYRSNPKGNDYEVIETESRMITGDYNIVNIDFFIEYKVSDPVKYLFASESPELVLKNLVQSQIRNVVGSSTVDSVLTDGKADIQSQIKTLTTEVLEQYDIGLILTDVKIQDSEPPTESVIEAFKAVETAKQGAETAINQAKAYENSELPKAQAEADKLIQNAEYLKQNRINDATKIVAKFNAMYEEYAKNPDITRTRMYYEMITEALPGVKLYIDTSDGSTQKLLPLENFTGSTTAN
ncbi:MAG: FtsH protease activity modulator HflK [Ruminococcaceae bacterium]|nr:FtsH protease activity modulator HflK [Oscillospiraceae bacterium]